MSKKNTAEDTVGLFQQYLQQELVDPLRSLGRFLAYPILSEADLSNQEYDIVLVCAWNYQEEILLKSEKIFKKGTKLIFPLPEFKVVIV